MTERYIVRYLYMDRQMEDRQIRENKKQPEINFLVWLMQQQKYVSISLGSKHINTQKTIHE